jgi:hypothetical protein
MKKLLAVLIVLLGVVMLSSCSADPEPRAGQVQEDVGTTSDPSEFAYDGEDGKTVLELLHDNAEEVGVVGAGASAYVTSINGVEAHEAQNEFWALYVDGAAATTGAGSLETTSGQTIEWRLETFS